jgi:hypothetical protein
MSRLPVTESSKVHKVSDPLTSATTERNRLMSWDSTVQELTKPDDGVPGLKTASILWPFGFASKIIRVIFASLAKLPYALFKLGYEIAKLVTKRLSSLRRLLFMRK